MKRYGFVYVLIDGTPEMGMQENPNGKWVKWENVKGYMERMNAIAIARAIIEIEINKMKKFMGE